jgi:hypothetical protein
MNRTTVAGKDGQYTAYIKNNLTGTKIPFPVMPQGISESTSANFTQQDIIGASVPRVVYNSTGAKTLNFSLQNLTEDYVAQGFTNLKQYVRALQALTYPTYGSGGVVSSPSITLVLGDRTMRCVCTNVSVSWGTLTREQQILSCNVDLSFLMTRLDIPGATTIETSG